MNVEIRTEAAQFPEKEYINGIFFAVHTVVAPSKREAFRMIVDHNAIWNDETRIKK
jgi:hypothetical protein